jgi:hypothetical protein
VKVARWILIWLAVATVYCAKGTADQMSLLHDRNPIYTEGLDSGTSTGFWQQVEQAFDQRTDEVFTDEMHPLRVMGWRLKHPDESWAGVVGHDSRSAQSAFMNSLEYTLRDVAANLPFMDGVESSEDWFSELFLDSLDAVEEESVSPLDPLYRPTERIWWHSLEQKRVLRYGLRPFDPDPYAFLSLRLIKADELLLLTHFRYYFQDFADHRFELAVSLPLAHGIAVDVGTAYQFGQHAEEKKLVVKLFKALKGGGIVHVGIEVQRYPALFAGISLPM